MSRDPRKQIRDGDPWYIEDQQIAAQKTHLKRLFRDRLSVVLKVLEELAANTGDSLRVLDLGCGDGSFLRHLGKGRTAWVCGCDYNELRLLRLRGKGYSKPLALCDARYPCFEAECFNLLLMNHIIEHVEDDLQVLRAARKLLKQGGVLVLGVPNEGCFLGQLRNRILQRSIGRTTDHVHFYRRADVEALLSGAGFEVVSSHSETFFVPNYLLWSAIAATGMGYAFLKTLGRLIPSQTSGLLFVARPRSPGL